MSRLSQPDFPAIPGPGFLYSSTRTLPRLQPESNSPGFDPGARPHKPDTFEDSTRGEIVGRRFGFYATDTRLVKDPPRQFCHHLHCDSLSLKLGQNRVASLHHAARVGRSFESSTSAEHAITPTPENCIPAQPSNPVGILPRKVKKERQGVTGGFRRPRRRDNCFEELREASGILKFCIRKLESRRNQGEASRLEGLGCHGHGCWPVTLSVGWISKVQEQPIEFVDGSQDGPGYMVSRTIVSLDDTELRGPPVTLSHGMDQTARSRRDGHFSSPDPCECVADCELFIIEGAQPCPP